MSPVAKLAAFAGLVMLVFGGAAITGAAVGPDREGSLRAPHGDIMAGHGGDEEGRSRPGARAGGRRRRPEARARAELGAVARRAAFCDPRRRWPAGARLRGRAREAHASDPRASRRRGFQHVHPQLGDDGVWRVRLTLPEAGAYRVFADFVHDGEARTLAADLAVDGEADYQPLPAPAATASTDDGYEVSLDAGALRAGREAELSFSVSRARRAGPDRALPGRRRPPRGAARGRPRLPARSSRRSTATRSAS